MSEAQHAFSTELQVKDGASYEKIAELTDISGPSVTVDEIDASSHDSWRHTPAIDECTFDTTNNRVDAVGHGLRNDERVRFTTTDTLPASITDNRWYYTINVDDDHFQIAETKDGAVIEFDDDGTGTHSFHYAYPYREFISGMKDGGEVSVEGNLIFTGTDKTATDILGYLDEGTEEEYRIEFPDDTKWDFNAITTAFETTANFEDKATFTATFKVSGKPALS